MTFRSSDDSSRISQQTYQPPIPTPVWESQNPRDKTWMAYRLEDAASLEAVYKAGGTTLSLNIGGHAFQIDLHQMQQINSKGHRRPLRRVVSVTRAPQHTSVAPPKPKKTPFCPLSNLSTSTPRIDSFFSSRAVSQLSPAAPKEFHSMAPTTSAENARPLVVPEKRARSSSTEKHPPREAGPEARTDDCLFPAPAPRSSPLGLSATVTSINSIYEQALPEDELRSIYKAACIGCGDNPLTLGFPGIRLVGPFEVLHGKQFATDIDKWCDGRRAFDPPELLTVAIVDKTSVLCSSAKYLSGARLCIHRDSPEQMTYYAVLATVPSEKTFEIMGKSLTAALIHAMGTTSTPHPGAIALAKEMESTSLSLPNREALRRERKKEAPPGSSTYSGLGIAVPYVKKTEVGWREPMFNQKEMLTMLNAISSGTATKTQHEDLEEQLRFADIANDECDFGLGLQLGLDFLAAVPYPLHIKKSSGENKVFVLSQAVRLLDMAYMLLDRDLYGHIIKCHAYKTSRQELL